MRMLFTCFALIAVLPVATAQADDCASAMSQSAMNMCADQAYKKTDAELNTVYRQITSRLKDDKEKTKLLLVAQKNWLAFRDAECTFTTSASAQGSIYPMLVAQCRDGLTRRRIDDLKGYMTCEEGDMSCPVPSK
ncbi:uncharacterized protein YecT (DUF1311 family) [Luteibacter rhizovicinus]|uniref:Uncharacterized protein YecT (DUF1311 family) n=2 Tax=Luteibacter rhizovicinus TaxID=242606 RepID=A0A4R3YS43_9GAMM|nr:uncharacterized protein YecT (DUF1311 family) [Luteibacter rhizovicinus]